MLATLRKTANRTAVTLLLSIGIAACAASEGESGGSSPPSQEDIRQASEREREAGHLESAALLEDGVVDIVDYETAVNNATLCIAEYGLLASEPRLNPVDGLRLQFVVEWNGIDGEIADAAVVECQNAHMGAIETLYTATTTAKMDTPLREFTEKCMSEHGFPDTKGSSNLAGFAGPVEAVEEAQYNAAFSCISDGMTELYPDIFHYAISY